MAKSKVTMSQDDLQEANYAASDGFTEMQKDIHDLQLKIQNLTLSMNKRKRRTKAIDSDESDVDEDDIFPLKSVKQLSVFEKRLKKDKVFRKRLIKSMLKIGGKPKSENYKKVAEYTLKFCFDHKLLQLFSFTGISKNKNVPARMAFSRYPSIIRFIFKIIYRLDNTYSALKHENYLQNYFKHVREKGVKRRRTYESDEEVEVQGGHFIRKKIISYNRRHSN